MANKNAVLTEEQKKVMKKNDLNHVCWMVLKDLTHSMIVKHKITGEVKLLDK